MFFAAAKKKIFDYKMNFFVYFLGKTKIFDYEMKFFVFLLEKSKIFDYEMNFLVFLLGKIKKNLRFAFQSVECRNKKIQKFLRFTGIEEQSTLSLL